MRTDWTVGGPIVWRGEWDGKAYEDKGKILELEPGRRLVHTHFSPLSGQEDAPENYHTLTWTLEDQTGKTKLTLSQDNNAQRRGRPSTPRACGTSLWPTSRRSRNGPSSAVARHG